MASDELKEQLARLRADIIAILERNDVEASLASRERAIADEILDCCTMRIDRATTMIFGKGRGKNQGKA